MEPWKGPASAQSNGYEWEAGMRQEFLLSIADLNQTITLSLNCLDAVLISSNQVGYIEVTSAATLMMLCFFRNVGKNY